MAEENTNIQQPGEEVPPENLGVTFEDILPWGSEGGDTGLSARLKLKRNFEKIKMWFDSISITRLKELFLSKIEDDQANGMITFIKGLQVGDRFVTGLLGEGGVFRKEADGTTYLEADKLYIRIKAYFDNVEIRDFKHSAGNRIASPAGMKCCRVEWLDAGGDVVSQADANLPQVVKFRCYSRGDDGEDEVRNNFIVGDQAYCHITSVDTKADDPNSKGLNMKHYWRLVVGRNPSGTLTAGGEHWIDLSNRSSETLTIASNTYTHAGYQTGSDIPTAQDDIIQLGNIYDTDRMGAIIEFVTGADSPSYQIFQDINDFNLNGKNYIALGYSSQTGRAYLNVYGDTYIGDPEESTYIRYNAKTKKLDVKATVTFVSPTTHEDTTIEDFAAAVTSDINTIQNQIDGTIETWFYNGVPGDSTLPESQWKAIDEAAGNNNERLKHLGDMYYDNQTGYAYRYANQGTESQPKFVWTPISDSAVVKALADAAKAQDTADHKRRVFILPVTIDGVTYNNPYPPYDNGDLWVNAVWPASGSSQGSTYNNDILRCKTSKDSTQQFSINDWVKASKYTDDSALNDFVTNTYNKKIVDLENQIDGKAETWYQSEDPSLSTSTPHWTDDNANHVGDLWCDTSENGGKKTYIYQSRTSGDVTTYYWAEQAVPDGVFDKIDGKSSIFTNNPNNSDASKKYPTNYAENDLWILPVDATINGVSYKQGEVLTAINDYVSAYKASDWTKKVRYTDDTALETFVNDTYSPFVTDIQNQIDGKAETWYQSTNPATAWNTTELKQAHKGDIWHNTSSSTVAGVDAGQDAIWSGTAWVMTDVPQEVYDKIDGKASVYVTWNAWVVDGLNNLALNDLFIPSADTTQGNVTYKQNKVYCCTTAGSSPVFTEINYTDNAEFNNFVDVTYAADKEGLQNQIDGKYETWFYEGVPTLSNAPASTWTTVALKKVHLGDLYWDKTNKHAYRFVVNGSTYSWQQIGDKGVIAAMAQAADAQDTADHKRRVFTSTPTTPYDVGDLWAQGSGGDIMKCKTARATGSYKASDWELASKYTSDAALLEFLDGYTGNLGAAIKEQVDKKAETWVSSSNPATAWNTTALKDEHVGDMWLNTSNAAVVGVGSMKTAIYKKSGSSYSWVVDDSIPNSVFDTIDGKKTIYIYWDSTSASGGVTGAMKNGTLQVRDLFIPNSNITKGYIEGTSDSTIKYAKSKVYRCTKVGAYSDGAITTYPTFVEIAYTDDSSLNSFLNTVYGTTVLEQIKAQNDKKAETWYQDEDPSSQWTTTAMKDLHVGDIWHNASTSAIGGVDAGCDAIYTKSGSTYSWKMSDVPHGVYDTIDGKADIFVSKPSTYNVNDMWIIESGISTSDIPTGCKVGDIVISSAKRTNSFKASDWKKKDRYTDDSSLNTFKANEYVTQLTNGTISSNITKAQNAANTAQGTANSASTAAANAQTAAQAAEAHAATMDYVKTALKQDTVIDGGLVISTLLALRDGNNRIWSGINGAYKSAETGSGYKGHGIAAWYGGAMVDKEVTTTATDYAKSLFRFDGSGYVAGGNLSWDKNGNVTLQGYSINATTLTANGSAVATESMLAKYLPLSAGSDKKLTGTLYAQTILPKTDNTYNLGGTSNYWKYIYVKRIYLAADVYLEYDSTNTSVKLNGSLYATGGVSALGAGSGGSGGGGDVTWVLLASNSDTRQIALSHLTTALSSYATQSWVNQQISAYKPDLSNYLPLTGGTITGSIKGSNGAHLRVMMQKDTSNAIYGIEWFNTSSEEIGGIMFHNTAQRMIFNPIGASSAYLDKVGNYSFIVGNNELTYNTYTIYHAGNDGSDSGLDADLLDGLHSNEFPILSVKGTKFAENGTCDVTEVGTYYSPYASISASLTNTPHTTSNFKLWHLYTGLEQYPVQIAIAYYDAVYFRGNANGTWRNWKKFAFTDSDITGNAATATKLINKRTLWGRNFDGTANVNGVLNVTGSGSYSEGIRLHHLDGLSSIWFGAVEERGYDAGMWGISVNSNGMRFRGAASTTATSPADYMNILHGGNVGIGTTSPSHKLDVAGTFYASGNSSIGGTLGVTGAATLSSTLGVAGLLTASGGIKIPSGKTLQIGDAVLSWDSTNQGIKITKGLYSETFISALGTGSSSGTATTLATLADVNVTGAKNDDVLTYNSTTKKWEAKAVQTGTDMATVWAELGASTTNQINASHLTNALGSYAQKTELAKYLPLTAGSGNRITGFMYLSRQVSTTTSYTQTENRIYYTTPDSKDEILLRAIIRNNGTNNYCRIYSITPFSSIASNDVAAGTQGYTTLALGSDTLITNANSKSGRLRLYGMSNTDTETVRYGTIAPTVFTANRTYTLPDASGTIALTSNLSGYLPLTGGTLTGNLTINHNNGLVVQTDTGSKIFIKKDDGALGEYLGVEVHDAKNNYTTGILDYYTGNKNIRFGTHSTNILNFYGQNAVFYTGTSYTGDSGTPYTERMRILKSGNINIGDTPSADPGVKLNVDGDVKATTFIGALQGNADSATTASKLSVVSKKAWGQTYWTSGGIPTTISGNMTNVGSITMSGSITGATTISASSNVSVGGTLSVTGLLTASGGVTIPSGKTLTIGDAVLSWDATNQGIKITKGLYSETFISAYGRGSDSGAATSLSSLSDVNTSGVANGMALVYRSGTWRAETISSGTSGNYLPLSGGTMTGDIITPANDNIGIRPASDNYGQIGSSSYKFYRMYASNMYASTFYGELDGTISDETRGSFITSNNEFNFVPQVYTRDDLHFNYKAANGELCNRTISTYCFDDGKNNTLCSITSSGASAGSDIRKKDVKEYFRLRLDDIVSAPLIRFSWKNMNDKSLQVGSIAQYWKDVLPESVIEGTDGYLFMNDAKVALACSISLASNVQDHERRIAELEKENERLRTEIEQLKIA